MKLQLRVLFNTVKSLTTVHIFFYSTLFLYFFIYIFFNQYDFIYYQYIFGIIDFQNHISILLLLLNVSYLIITIYKYLTYEIKNFPFQIVLRENPKKWFAQKSVLIFIYIILFKCFQFIFWGMLSYILLKFPLLHISFYIENILLFVTISFIAITIVCFKNPLKYLSIFILFLYTVFNINIYTIIIFIIILELILVSNFSFKKTLYGHKK